MGAKAHRETIKDLCFLGQNSDMAVAAEWTVPIFSGSSLKLDSQEAYSPRIDIVWFLEVEEIIGKSRFKELVDFILSGLEIDGIPKELIKYIPYAAFEVEASDPSSKVIYSDCHNLVAANVSFKFVVIKEIQDMNRKRAERIVQSSKTLDGIQDIFLLTLTDLKDIMSGERVLIKEHPYKMQRRKMETIQKELSNIGTKLGFEVAHECIPSEFVQLGSGSQIYVPRLDQAWFIKVPRSALIIVSSLIYKSIFKHVKDLYKILTIGFEYEHTTSSKHIAGSISNLAHHTQLGILLMDSNRLSKAQRIVNKYAAVWGFNNVFVAPVHKVEISRAVHL